MKVPVMMIRAVLHVEPHIECRLEGLSNSSVENRHFSLFSQLPLYETVRGARVGSRRLRNVLLLSN